MSLLCGVPAAWYRYRVSLVGSQNTSHGNKCVSHVSNRAESEYFSQYFSQNVQYKENAPPPPPYRTNHGHPTN